MTAVDRAHPFAAALVEKHLLTGHGTQRPTLHVALSIAGSGIAYEPGDVVALFVRNEASLVDAVMAHSQLEDAPVTLPAVAALGQPAEESTLRRALTDKLSLGALPLRFLRAAVERISDDDEAVDLEELCDDAAALDAYLLEHDLIDFLQAHPALRFTAQELATLLPALQPRTYSIASSPKRHPDEVHLTVGLIEWTHNGRVRRGVASAHLSRMQLGETIPLYATASKHFRLPDDPRVPLVFVGPGTGVAPFRGFMQAQHEGPLWLFFGAQTRAHDFYYQSDLEAGPARVDTAFSRDQPERIYVQARMREHADELWRWLERGAHVYVCGDASKMAPDVERALVEIATTHGADAGWLERMKSERRYRRDVY